jgi:pimeloyl-ACP methyl ester carboxylesterase
MSRSFYSLAIFFTALSIFAALLHSIMYFQLDAQVYTLQSFPLWYAYLTVVSLIASVMILKYYHYKDYKFTFWTGTIFVGASVVQFVVVYSLFTGVRTLGVCYIPLVLIVLTASIVYGLSLAFSSTRVRPWLRAGGILACVFGLILLATVIWSKSPEDVQKNTTAQTIHQWVSLAGVLIPFLFIMNFLDERRILRKANVNAPPPPQRSPEIIMVVCVIAIVPMLFIGPKIWNERYWLHDWNSKAPEREKQLAKPFEARIYVNGQGDTLRYRLFRPVQYDTTKKYPLVVCLHHGGSHGTDNVKQVDGSQPAQMLYQQRTKFPAFLFVPQCPPGTNWGGIPGPLSTESLVFETIAALENEFSIDTTRRYVTGTSMGGFGSWHFISTHPEMFAAAIPICGGGDPKYAQAIASVPVWAFHGEKDRSVPVSLSRDMIEGMKKAGGDPKYTEFAGAGHNIWDSVKATPDVMDWLFEQRRN